MVRPPGVKREVGSRLGGNQERLGGTDLRERKEHLVCGKCFILGS